MKTLILHAALLLLAMAGTAITAFAKGGEDRKDLESTVREFVSAGDARDLGKLEAVLAKDFRVLVSDPGKGVASVLDRAAYLSLIEQKVIGGDSRTLKIGKVVMGENGFATVTAELEGNKAVFHNQLTLVRTGEGWRIVQDAVWMQPK